LKHTSWPNGKTPIPGDFKRRHPGETGLGFLGVKTPPNVQSNSMKSGDGSAKKWKAQRFYFF